MTEERRPQYYRLNLKPSDEHLAMLANALGAAWQEGRVCEPYFILWEPGSRTPFHDHDAPGVIVGVWGTVVEEQFDVATKMPIVQRRVDRGLTCFEDARYIQRLGNPGKTVALTLHLFSGNGPMKTRTYTDEEMRVGQ